MRFTLLDRDRIIKNFLSGLFFPQITPPLQVIHQVKAKADCKGGKHDLCIKKGESVDIIRITDNPEGKWLGRSQDGSCKSSHYKKFDDVNWSLITPHEHFDKTWLRKDTCSYFSIFQLAMLKRKWLRSTLASWRIKACLYLLTWKMRRCTMMWNLWIIKGKNL